MRFCLLLILPLLFLDTTAQAANSLVLPPTSVQLPATGQTGCWDGIGTSISCSSSGGIGQDGALRAGIDWSRGQRFVDGRDGTITDQLTGLVWLKNANCTETLGGVYRSEVRGLINWTDSLAWTRNLASGSCGLTDGTVTGTWRVPNALEMSSLFNDQEPVFSTWLQAQGFNNTVDDAYWTSTTDADLHWNAIAAIPTYGTFLQAKLKSETARVWPVRSGKAAGKVSIPKTGQFSCWDTAGNLLPTCAGTGQDGEIRAGVAWPKLRFVDNGNGTLTDNLTGLVWLKNANCAPVSGWDNLWRWTDALDWSNHLASGSCGLSDGSVAGDWRLPNRTEMLSLANFQQSSISIWLRDQGFVNVQDRSFWTSTTNAINIKSMAYAVMMKGSISNLWKDFKANISTLPVRNARSFQLSVTRNGTGAGSVASDTGNLSWSGNIGTASHPEGASVTLTATPASGSRFAGWDGACTGTGTCQVTMSSVNNVTATFHALPEFCLPPTFLGVPDSDDDGSFTVSWGVSATAQASYVLEEATNSDFTTGLRPAYTGLLSSATISGRGPGTYYYRVKALKDPLSPSSWQVAVNGCRVMPQPAVTPEPRIFGANLVDWLNHEAGTLPVPLQLGLSHAPSGAADWWLVRTNPSSPDIYFYDLANGWTANSWAPTYTGTLSDSDFTFPVEICRENPPPGTYTYYFGVDTVPDGQITADSLSYDTINLQVVNQPVNSCLWFPNTLGSNWVMQLNEPSFNGYASTITTTVSAVNFDTIPRKVTYTQVTTTPTGPMRIDTDYLLFACNNRAIERQTSFTSQGGTLSTTFTPPLSGTPEDFSGGSSIEQSAATRNDGCTYQVTYDLSVLPEIELVSVPAGSFQAVKYSLKKTRPTACGNQGGWTKTTYWVADRVGVVKYVIEASDSPDISTAELTTYSIH